MVLAYSSGGLVREVRGALADVGESELVVAAQNHRAGMAAARWSSAGTFGGTLCINSSLLPPKPFQPGSPPLTGRTTAAP